MRYAGVNGIALPSHQVIRLTVNGQHDFTLQYGAYLLTLMLDPLPGCGSRLVRFKNHRQRAVRIAIMNQLHRHPLTADFNQIVLIDNHLGSAGFSGSEKNSESDSP